MMHDDVDDLLIKANDDDDETRVVSSLSLSRMEQSEKRWAITSQQQQQQRTTRNEKWRGFYFRFFKKKRVSAHNRVPQHEKRISPVGVGGRQREGGRGWTHVSGDGG